VPLAPLEKPVSPNPETPTPIAADALQAVSVPSEFIHKGTSTL